MCTHRVNESWNNVIIHLKVRKESQFSHFAFPEVDVSVE